MTAATPMVNLLVVDDDLMLRSMAVKALAHGGFNVMDASNGEQALARFDGAPADLVLLDVMMPGMDGYEVCRRIRARPLGARVPVLMLTGLNDTGSIEQAYASGATDFITKPINWTLLSHRVRYALRASAAAEAMRHTSETLVRAQSMAGMASWQYYLDGRFEYSEQLVTLFGEPPGGYKPDSAKILLERIVPRDRNRLKEARNRLMQEGIAYQLEFQIETFGGVVRTVFEQAIRRPDGGGKLLGMEGITQDITPHVQAREQIRQLENFDGVTGLPNRRFFAELSAPPLDWAQRNGAMCALMHIDLDRFKGVNDAFGRAEGDAVLQSISERLRAWSRNGAPAPAGRAPAGSGVLARVGSNAFTLLIGNLSGQEHAGAVAQRLLKAIALPLQVQAQSLVLTASVGIALFPEDAQDLPGLSRCAEQAVYAAKTAGRGQHRFFKEQMNVHAANRLLLESDLRRAIARGELRLHFQPKVNAMTRAIVGAEALVRWQHPARGLVSPAEFMLLAEETGLILPLTDWVLECACSHLRQWADAGLPAVPLSVNLAASSFVDMSLVDKLDVLVQLFALAPSCLTLEVTETILMRDMDHTITMLDTLRARGYGVSLDDFGTGYSSLSYLKRLTVDELKVDRSFVTECAQGGRDGVLAATIIALGLELGLRVVAEGIETHEQSEFVLNRGCVVQQGFLFSGPVTAAEFERMLRDGLETQREPPSNFQIAI